MMKNEHNSERGQAILLLALGAVAMLGFAALAIDGGMVYSDRRHAQNAADAASLAGALSASQAMEANDIYYGNFDCSSISTVTTAAENGAITRAGSNDYTIDTDVSDNHGVEIICVDDEDKGAYIDKYLDIRTVITRNTNTSLIHFVYSGPVVGTVETTTRIRPRTPLAFGHAVVALNDSACSGNSLIGVKFSGSSDVDINGGGVYSNGCLVCGGSSFDVDVVDGNVSYADSTTCAAGDPVSPSPQSTSQLPPSAMVASPPDCSGLPNQGNHSGSGTIQPGVYGKISLSNGSLVMNPGLYCLTGSPNAFKLTGGDISGNGVTIYVQNGGVDISGNVDPVDLRAPAANPDPSPAISGMLIFLAEGNSNPVSLTGNNNSYYEGTIYVPDGNIKATGSNGTFPTFNTQLIGFNVEVTGNATIDINFNGSENYAVPPKLDLQE
ncbi:MAG: Tad domain-containing protein [Chloroflexota bacterium]|nr:Tad domain-containing protein [Chloroflexota bacterium]